MKKVSQNLLLIFSLGLIFILFTGPLNADKSKTKMVKPDLKVESLTVNNIGKAKNGGIKVNIRIVIKNIAKLSSKSGSFKLGLKYQDGQTGPYQNLKNVVITSLNTNAKIKRPSMKVLSFQDTVPAGIKRKYQAEIDSGRQVAELTRNNNTMYAEFRNPNSRSLAAGGTMASTRAFPPCEGVDIIVSTVEIIRNDEGRIFLRAKMKNLCTDDCSGPLELVIDESAAGGAGISTSFGSMLAGETESPWSGWLGVYYNMEGGDNTYTVSIRIGAPCVDKNPGNNSLTVTLRAGENSKTVNF